ncbi:MULTISPECIES: hypothetical protein [Streptomyces]|uniref:hypothetical protein n=1 Tax=Streptomyces TaxID=1883 RepID=UPI00364BF1FA
MSSLSRIRVAGFEGVHTLNQSDDGDEIRTYCAGVNEKLDAAVARGEFTAARGIWPTCSACLGCEWADDPASEDRWLEDHGQPPLTEADKEERRQWRRESQDYAGGNYDISDTPAPQISRRETY